MGNSEYFDDFSNSFCIILYIIMNKPLFTYTQKLLYFPLHFSLHFSFIEIKCNLEVKARMNNIMLCHFFWNMNSKFATSETSDTFSSALELSEHDCYQLD